MKVGIGECFVAANVSSWHIPEEPISVKNVRSLG
jgi:hypothetical protein